MNSIFEQCECGNEEEIGRAYCYMQPKHGGGRGKWKDLKARRIVERRKNCGNGGE